MQIVIDISEDDYNFVKRQMADGTTNPLKICIAKGALLPKGHGRLIDADALVDTLDASDRDIYCKAVIEEDAPTIIEADGCTCKESEI